MSVSTADNFATISIATPELPNNTQSFTSADQITPPRALPGTSNAAWSAVDSGGVKTTLQITDFSALPLTYIKFSTVYLEGANSKSQYNNQVVFGAIGSEPTRESAMPISGSGYYFGNSYGYASGGGFTYRTTSDFHLTANFSSQQLNGAFDKFKFYDYSTGALVATPANAEGLSQGFNASLTGSTFKTSLRPAGSPLPAVQGQFFGPSAQEVGGSYYMYTSELNFLGAFASSARPAAVPAPDPNYLPSAVQQLLATGQTLNYASASIPVSGNQTNVEGSGPDAPGVTYDPITGEYSVYTPDFSTLLPHTLAVKFSAKQLKSTENGKRNFFDTGSGSTLSLFAPTASAPFTLTYTSYALLNVPGGNGLRAVNQAIVFGAQTATIPTSGTATYSGIIDGFATDLNRNSYDLNGTSSLSVNFATGSFSTSLNISGVANSSSGTNFSNQMFSGSSSFSSGAFALSGDLNMSTGEKVGSFRGNFYGPAAQEFGYSFGILTPVPISVNGSPITTIQATYAGVAVGKKD